MNDTIDIRMSLEDLFDSWLICYVDLVELGSLAAQQLNAIQADFGRIVQTVNDDDFITMLKKGERGEGSNVSCTTGDENFSNSHDSSRAVQYRCSLRLELSLTAGIWRQLAAG